MVLHLSDFGLNLRNEMSVMISCLSQKKYNLSHTFVSYFRDNFKIIY